VAFPTVTFPDFDSTTSPHWEYLLLQRQSSTKFRAALQLLICPNGRVDGKLSGFLRPFSICDNTTQPCTGCTNQSMPQYCQGTIDYATLDAAFRKATALSRFQLARNFVSSSEASCSSGSWDGRTCMNSLMAVEASKCHIVNVSFACLARVAWNVTRSGKKCKENWTGDYAARTQKSLSDCKASCQADKKCRAITHGTQNGVENCILCTGPEIQKDHKFEDSSWATSYSYNPQYQQQCTDTPSSWMSNNGKTCSEDVDYSTKCNHSSTWSNNKYCQQSCYDNGAGYDGDYCSDACASLDELPTGFFRLDKFTQMLPKTDGTTMGLPAAFKECVQGGTKHGTCSLKLCNDVFDFQITWPMKLEFAGAYTASRQWYRLPANGDITGFSFDWD